MKYDRRQYSNDILMHLYKGLLKPRMIEEKMLILLRQGRVSKWFSGIGQEAISVGLTLALNPDDYILPMHRNLGVFTCRNMELGQMFAQFQGKYEGFSKGRERSFHFGSKPHHIVGMISHLGPQNGIADGIALASLLQKNNKVTAVFNGDGGTSQGDFHESLNVAAVWDLPVLFIVENNGYGLSTPSDEQFRCRQFIDKGIGYGMEAYQVDGNNIVDVYDMVRNLTESMRKKPRPVLLECMTFRMRGHEEASGTKYVPKELIEEWGKKDPLVNFENYLKDNGILTEVLIDELKATIKKEIDGGLEYAFALPNITPNSTNEIADVYAPYTQEDKPSNRAVVEKKRLVDALAEGMSMAMSKHDNLVLMGQDIAEYGGVFKITEGLVEKFGKARVRNTPLCESAIIGTSLGLSIMGHKAMVEMQFADFVTCGFNQIINNLAKSHYRWAQNADVVVRMPTGAGVGAGPFHSQSNEAWFTHTPGLKVVYPSTPEDAKGLLLAAFEDPNPIMFFEHKALYRTITGDVPADYYTTPIGKARIVREGKACSIITYGAGVHWATDYVTEHNIDADIIDLRTLLPYDVDAIAATVKKTNRVLLLHEDCLTGGIAGEIAAYISEHLFEHLDAPVVRCASMDTPVPFSVELENNFLAKHKLGECLDKLLGY
jgi:2-oxoisovalerate dehydrogenase E1 component